MADIFISYAKEDHSRVEPFAKVLAEQGWSVWWDRTIPAGKTWREVIGEALENARSVIVAWSKTSVKSRWVQEEADLGLERKILIPILIDDVRPPLGFGSVQAVNLIKWDASQSSLEFEKLIFDLSSILGPSPFKAKEIAQNNKEEKIRGRREEERKRREDKQRKAEDERKQKEAKAKRVVEEDKSFREQEELKNKAEEEEREEEEHKRKQEEKRESKEVKAEIKVDKSKPVKAKTSELTSAPKVTQKEVGKVHFKTAQTTQKPKISTVPQENQTSIERRVGRTFALATIGGFALIYIIAITSRAIGIPLWRIDGPLDGSICLYVGTPMIVNNLLLVATASAVAWFFVWRNHIPTGTMLLASGIVGGLAIGTVLIFYVKGSIGIAGTSYIIFYNILMSSGVGLTLAIACEILQRKTRL
jgi:hypothetical protein